MPLHHHLQFAGNGLTTDRSHLALANDVGKIPPALFLRAQGLNDEYKEIEGLLAKDFDAEKAKRLGDVKGVATAFQEYQDAKLSLDELHAILKSDDKELHDMAEMEIDAAKTRLELLAHKLTAKLTPKHPFEHLPCLVEVRPGAGGQEGRLFADSVFRMYRQYCARKSYRCRVIKQEVSDGASASSYQEVPLLEGIMEVLDEGAYGDFRSEAGIHRVQRVPTTETKGRTHTSAVAVWVLPSFPDTGSNPTDWENPESDFYIAPQEVKAEKMRASGAGGQHVNKTESAIRLTHIPTGIQVSMQDNRSQQQNKVNAWKILRSRIAQVRREERERQAENLRNAILARDKTGRTDKIRTYNYGQDRCTDHRSGLDVHNLPDVLQGGETLEKVMVSAKDWFISKEVRALIAEEEAKAQQTSNSEGKKRKNEPTKKIT